MSRHALGFRFGHKFRSGGHLESFDVPHPYHCAIGGHNYLIDFAHYTVQTVDPFRTARDFDASPGEHSLNPENTWKRNRDDWRHGGGQFYADGSSADDTRFSSSKGVDWTVDRELSLLHDTEIVLATAQTNLRTLYVGGWLYVLDGSTLRFTNAPHAPTITWTPVTLAAAGVDLTTDGNKIYVALAGGAGIYSLPIGSATLTHMTNAAATDVVTILAYCNGWLIAGVANVLTGIAADGTHQQPFTHPVTAGRWVAAVGAPNAIYAAFVAADVSLIYRLGVDAGTGGLAVPILATPMPAGETVTSLGFYASRLLVGTNRGVRVGEIAGDGSVGLGPLIASGASVRCFGSFEALTFFGWSNYDQVSTGLGVMRLSDLVAANQPAWSSWLMSPDAVTVQGAVTSLAVVDGAAWFTIAGTGLARPVAGYVKQGTLDQGRFTFGVHESKAWSSLEVITAPLDGAVGAVLENDDGTRFTLGLLSVPATTGIGNLLSAIGQFGEQASVLLTLYRDVATGLKTPKVRRITWRALPNPITATKWIVPLILKTMDNTQEGEGQDVHSYVADELRYLRQLNRSLRPVPWQVGLERNTVQVRSIDLPEGMADGFDTDEREAIQGIYMVTLVSAGGK